MVCTGKAREAEEAEERRNEAPIAPKLHIKRLCRCRTVRSEYIEKKERGDVCVFTLPD